MREEGEGRMEEGGEGEGGGREEGEGRREKGNRSDGRGESMISIVLAGFW